MIRRRKILPPTYARILHNLCVGKSLGPLTTEASAFLQSKKLIKSSGFMRPVIDVTAEGVKAHRENCCKQGMDEEDVVVQEVERKLAGETEPLHELKAQRYLMNEQDWNDVKKWGDKNG